MFPTFTQDLKTIYYFMSIENSNQLDVKEKLIKLPPGFRFQPTDQEIVFQYLVRKIFSCPLPASIIPEIVNICMFNPWDLPGEWEQERYFFSKKDAKGNRVNRKSGDGYWKATGCDKHITRRCCRKKETITGMKKTLVFYRSKPSMTRTHWIMHEYRLVHSPANDKKSWIQMGNWVLCHVLLSKKSGKSLKDDNGKIYGSRERLVHPNFTMINSDEESTSSCGSSVVTQEESSCTKLLDHQDTNNNV